MARPGSRGPDSPPVPTRTELAVPPGEKLLAILHVCQRLASERDLAALLDLIAREGARLLDAERSSIFLLDRERMELYSQIALGADPIRFDAHYGIAGAVVKSGETINVPDVRRDTRFYSKIDEGGGYVTRSILATPLTTPQGGLIGVFEVLNRRHGSFDSEDEDIARALAAQAAVAIETVQLLQELERSRDQLLDENTRLWKEVEGHRWPARILGNHEKVQGILRLVERIRDTSVDVLITGESGTGKELVARSIHYTSPRARRPLIALNCAALPENLIETELFGIEKGVATGVEQKTGKFEEADGGTLFLDEIGDLSAAAQAKILRALQERVIDRVGGRKPVPVDVRIVAATNRDLSAREGSFRQDLYYRLNVVHIRTVPLREMATDIPLLASHLLARSAAELARPEKRLSSEAATRLQAHDWPGNVRELENEMKRLTLLAPGRVIREEDLSEAVRGRMPGESDARSSSGTLRESVEALERRMIAGALGRTQGNQQQAARLLGLSRQGLIKKMKRYGLHPTARD